MAKPPFDVTLKGVVLQTYGLTDWNVFDGLGLVSDGLIWSCPNIWYGPYNSNGATMISSSWSLYVSCTLTTWTLYSGTTIVTNWTAFSTYNREDC